MTEFLERALANAESVPNWVKTNAGWWASGDIDQQSFIQGIEYLVNQGIISVPVQKVSGEKSETVPDWIKNTAGWWAEDAISDAEFVRAVEFLVAENIISVQVDALNEIKMPTSNLNRIILYNIIIFRSHTGQFQQAYTEFFMLTYALQVLKLSNKLDLLNALIYDFSIINLYFTTHLFLDYTRFYYTPIPRLH